MPGCCATFARAAERQFNEKKAAEELARYRKNGPLLDAAISHAEQCFALSYPRDAWYVRLGLALENRRRRVSGNTFRTFVHPVADMEQTITRAGFERSSRSKTWMWSLDVYRRPHRDRMATAAQRETVEEG